ncbi:hypothetical protein [Pelagicoccus sp. SDUM812005]|uniref:hypothetical protein n=1 Tax=Pelagicoccus sp. SDUM812005 TaxID=3041257 RepID=UPI00280DA403|nr:hypothetical protein [Pelagicoccus sp. SDUM812005]MDQ8179132.1 hypothetical protein [Pelagicoccus sp. SDUM812005]
MTEKSMCSLFAKVFVWLFASFACFASGQTGSWESTLDGISEPLVVKVEGAGYVKTAIVLENLPHLPVSKVRSTRAKVLLRSKGFRIVSIDYGESVAATFPAICNDIYQLRSDILQGKLLRDLGLDWDQARVFILPEGQVVETDVLHYEDGDRNLYLDITYPLIEEEGARVPCLLEFSCDNRERMGNFSLVACRDTLLEGLAFAGYATAMADHPVAPPYKGLDSMPDSAYKVKSAVRTLRAEGKWIGLSGEIAAIGFSRGSGMALLLATTEGIESFEKKGFCLGEESSIQAAVVLSGRFSYLELLDGDPMLLRYKKAWGSSPAAHGVWKAHGALDYLKIPTIPLFLSINSGEGRDAQHQMKILRARLGDIGSEYVYLEDGDGMGHKVPISSGVLERIEAYLDTRLKLP